MLYLLLCTILTIDVLSYIILTVVCLSINISLLLMPFCLLFSPRLSSYSQKPCKRAIVVVDIVVFRGVRNLIKMSASLNLY